MQKSGDIWEVVYQVPAGGVILKNTKSIFTAVVSPNPFNECFSLHVQSPLKEPITISIFDVLGKQLSTEILNVETIKNVTFGKGLASGVYQVVIIQGENKEIIKVIKN